MGVVGIKKETWAGTPDVGFEMVPIGAATMFEVSEVLEGEGGEKERVDIICQTVDDAGQVFKHREFLHIDSEKGLGWAKKFLCSIGRGDICREDADWQDLVGTEFTADVQKRMYNGQESRQLREIRPASHDMTEIPADMAPAAAAPAAGRPARGKSPR